MKKEKNFLDYFFLLRPTIQVALWTFYFIGVYLAFRDEKSLKFLNIDFNLKVYYILFAYSLLMGGVYILNQITDIETDKINKKLFLLPEKIISLKESYILVVLCIISGFLMVLLNFKVQKIIVILFIVSFILGYLYSSKPFHFKGKPFLDLLSNVIGYSIVAPIIGYLSIRDSLPDFKIFLPYIFSMAAIFINTTILDYNGDKKIGLKTTGVFLGIKLSLFLSTLFISLGLLFALFNRDNLAIYTTGYSLIFFFLSFLFKKENYVMWSVKYTSPFVTLVVGLFFLPFLIICFLTLILSIIYYKKRFKYTIV